MTIEVIDGEDVNIDLIFRPGCLTYAEALTLAEYVAMAVDEVTKKPRQSIQDLSLLTDTDLRRIWKWNASTPMPVDRCVHDMINDIVKAQPEAQAVHAWDGNLTYQELDHLSSRVADQLLELGVAPESLIPLCFDKSMWTPVSIIGVLKAGAAFVLLDSALPEQRLQSIVEQVNAPMVLSSSSHVELSSRLCNQVVEISKDTLSLAINGIGTKYIQAPSLSPSNALFAVFTSGTTGTPKGIVQTHSNFASLLGHQAQLIGFNRKSRVFDFASYAFDVAIHNVFATFTTGGCLCIPFQQDRMENLGSLISSMGATIADITPTIARFIDPATVPELETLILSGELASAEEVARWHGKLRVVNIYGPSECTNSTINIDAPTPEEATYLGKGFGVGTWVVDPDNHNALMPVGHIGELIVEGPLVSRGYLNDPARTAKSFIEDPPWLITGAFPYTGRRGRLYKTGDLVRYTENGTLVFAGRKDAQVKIRGQRVELAEVEHHVHIHMPLADHVVVEVIEPQAETRQQVLAAFIHVHKNNGADDNGNKDVLPLPLSVEIEEALTQKLPRYMIPSILLQVQDWPMTATGKVSRRGLREIGQKLSMAELDEVRTSKGRSGQQPTTPIQKALQKVWSEVLNIRQDAIGLDDGFFRLGGDSTSAIRTVATARKAGLQLTVADIFRFPNLREMSNQVHDIASALSDKIPAFSLLDKSVDERVFVRNLAEELHVNPVDIQDAYPCTPLQEGLMSLSLQRPGDYLMQEALELSSNVDLQKFCHAWGAVSREMPILRTRLVRGSVGLLQTVVNDEIAWKQGTTLEKYLDEDRATPMGLGQRLTRYALVKDDSNTVRWFVWTIHHSLYDGWSSPLIISAVKRAYQGFSPKPQTQFQSFIKYLQSLGTEAVESYWLKTLQSGEPQLFPSLPTATTRPMVDGVIHHTIPYHHKASSSATLSTLLRAALALVMGDLTRSKDIVYGITVSGRTAPVLGIENIAAPTFATVPLRIQWASDITIDQYLAAVQSQAVEMIPFEQIGLHRLAELSPECQRASQFQTLLVVQDSQSDTGENDFFGQWQQNDEQDKWFNTYGLIIECEIGSDSISVKASFDSRMIDAWTVRALQERLDGTLARLSQAKTGLRLRDIDIMSETELHQMWERNIDVPEPSHRLVHDMISERARTNPTAIAIHAWDGDFTYEELEKLSTRLSNHLVKQGVKAQDFVPLCFEKSKWTTVAILAVMKSGGSFVLLDPNLPLQRLHSIVRELDVKFLLASPATETLATSLFQTPSIIDEEMMSNLEDGVVEILQQPDLDSIIYVVFTSGTTGTPKGAVISHRNSASAVLHQVKTLGYTKQTRVYDFSAYSFDGTILNAFPALVAGGCLCVPTEQGRKDDLARSMESLKANTIFLTPTVARLLVPGEVPHLTYILIGGEAIHVKDILPWWGRIRVTTLYGPSECTPVSLINNTPGSPEDALHLGTGSGVVTWVVDPDDHDRLVPPGCDGELLMEGPIIGQGYLHRAVETSQTFIEDPAWLLSGTPAHPGRRGRLYKTGDIVRRNQDGSLSFVGRKGSQVKIHGQRVELAEVEHWVQQSMPEASLVAAEIISPKGEKTDLQILAAFLQITHAESGSRQTTTPGVPKVLSVSEGVEEKLAQHLPSYMIPQVFFTVPELPVGTTGKMDRKALRTMGSAFSAQQLVDQRVTESKPKRSPQTAVEKQLQLIWADTLGLEPLTIGLDDSFFKLGGNSITAMKLVGEARRVGLKLEVADIFRSSRLYQVAKQAVPLTGKASQSIIASQTEGPVEQSFAQGRLWFLEQLYPGLTWYIMSSAMRLRGPLQLDALDRAFSSLTTRHETLRTTFSTRQGVSLQHVHDANHLSLEPVVLSPDEASIMDVVEREESMPFDLENSPGWRTRIFKFGEDDHLLLITMHHIISDGWSIDTLRKELSAFYSSSLSGLDPLQHVSPLPIQYRDFSIWEKQEQQVDAHRKQLDYWVSELETSKPAELFSDFPRPAALSGKASKQDVLLDGPLYERLQRMCSQYDVTPYILLLAAFAATHYRLTGQDDATFGSPNANRDRWEVRDTIGFFVNLQCLRVRLDEGAINFETLLRQVKATATSSLANQDVPFEKVVSKLGKARDLSHHPLVQMVFALHSQLDLGRFTLEGLEVEYIDHSFTTRFDLEFHLYQETHGLRGEMIFSTDLYHPKTISNLLSVFYKVLEEVLDSPTRPITSLPLLTNDAYSALDSLGLVQVVNSDYPRDLTVVDVFRNQTVQHPERVAVKDSSTTLTYGQLDALSDDLARWLEQFEYKREKLVGVYSNRSCQTIIAFLGILKAGLAYLPFDSQVPVTRMQNILSSVGEDSLVLLGDDQQVPKLDLPNIRCVRIKEILCQSKPNGHTVSASRSDTVASPSPQSLAYVMFTSGTTGQPKGVMIEHRSIVRLAKENAMMHHDPKTEVMAHISSIAFDASTWEIYVTLLNGGTLVCVDTTSVLDYHSVSTIFEREQVQTIFITPALLKTYLSECPSTISGLNTLYIGGDKLDTQDVATAGALIKGSIINGYGPTENTSFSTFYPLPSDEACVNGVPIGRALSNSGAYILDSEQRLVPLGVVGELVVTGDGLARGYTDPKHNVDRFILITIDGKQVKAYRTGDFVRYRPTDGQIEFFGRMDGQTKIRGQRVEPAEIEHAMRRHRSIKDAVVLVQRDQGQDAHLVGFVTLHQSAFESPTPDPKDEDDDQAHQVSTWEELFDKDTYRLIEEVKPESVGRDFVGWTSMYDGNAIDKGEMNEWLDDTINTIRRSGESSRILEVGSGSGMILFNLIQGLQSYVGLDPAQRAVSFINSMAAKMPELTDKIHMHKGTAADVPVLDLNGDMYPSMVVVNSVAQYFPSQEYLLNLVGNLIKRESIKTLFFGDMRSHSLYQEFRVTRAMRMFGEQMSLKELSTRLSDMEHSELEYLVAPSFFTSLSAHFPGLIGHVEIIPKTMKASNELSCYRYAAVVHLAHRDETARSRPIYSVDENFWIDFMEAGLDHASLLALLKQNHSQEVAVSNIPHSKTIVERYAVDLLNESSGTETEDQGWVKASRIRAQAQPSLSAYDLRQLAREAGFEVEISWARQRSLRGGFDAIFHRRTRPQDGTRVLFQFPIDASDPHALVSTRPLQQQARKRVWEEVYDRLRSELPASMIPKAIHIIESIPVNPNGKVDRQRLGEKIQQGNKPVGPKRQVASEEERQMQRIWAQVLKVDAASIGSDDSFFQLGGDSLAAMKLVGEVRKLGGKLSIADVFRQPALRDVALKAEALSGRDRAGIPRTTASGAVDQSFAQGRIWFLEQLYPMLSWYLMPSTTRFRGPLDLEALQTAIFALENRHETLRTVFESRDSGDFQLVKPAERRPFNTVQVADMTALEDSLKIDHEAPFDLRTQPGWRVSVFELEPDDYVVSIVMHHIISDGWSVDVLQKEVSAFYAAAIHHQDPLSCVEPLTIQYKDYAVWQRQAQQIAEQEHQLDYWVSHLRTSQPAEFLCDKPRPTTLSGEAAVERLRIEGPLYDMLRQFCKQHSVTPNIVLLATYRATHYRLTGSTDANIGILNSNRDKWELKNIIGFFANLQCIRLLVEDDTFEQLVKQAQKAMAAAFENQDVPFENIVAKLKKDRDLSRNPLAQVIFAFNPQQNLGTFDLEGVSSEQIPVPPTTRFDMEFHFYQEQDYLQGEVLFSTDLYDSSTISNMLSIFEKVLSEGLGEPTLSISSLPLLTKENALELERLDLIAIDRREYPRDQSLVGLFREQAQKCPDRTAVKDNTSQLTYRELDHESDILARWLSITGDMAPEDLVGIFSGRSCNMIIAQLGILKANLACLPLDTRTPRGRLGNMLSSLPSRRLVLTGTHDEFPDIQGVEFVRIEDALEAGRKLAITNETAGDLPAPTSLACVLFTSGSTGKPKGVMLEHRGLVRLMKNSNYIRCFPSRPITAHMANVAFDVAQWEMYMTLLNGGTLICIDTMALLDANIRTEIFERECIQSVTATPAVLKAFLAESPSIIRQLETVCVTGERADPYDLIKTRTLMKGTIVNAYGPTENTCISSMWYMKPGDIYTNGVPIGRTLSNSGAYVMDSQQRIVPVGVFGELVVTGDGVARGYTDPGRDVNRFVTVSIGGVSVRAYRTGDYARWRPIDGQLEFFGRIDGQIKIRGHRVELGEIEHSLRDHHMVTDSAVVLQNERTDQARLLGFITVREVEDERALQNDDTTEHLQVWEELFDADTYTNIEDVESENIGRDFVGWVSMYDGKQIETEQMDEWLDETIDTISNGNNPQNVLEIGTGTGMILFNMTQGLTNYVGIEPSNKAVDFVLKAARSTPALTDKIRMYKGTAEDVAKLPVLASPTVAVVNSVVQYFPSQEYLFRVIQDLLLKGGVESIFLGDVRSFALYREFRASKALHMTGERASKDEIQQKMAEVERSELELLVDPAFFTALLDQLPDLVRHVEILPKRMRATNELSCYRYAVVIHAKVQDQAATDVQQPIHEVNPTEWIDFVEEGLDHKSLLQLLEPSVISSLAVSNIPYSKTAFEQQLVKSLDDGIDRYDWIASAKKSASEASSLSPTDLEDISRQTGYKVELSWARQYSQRGGLDAIFHRVDSSRGHTRTLFRFPTEANVGQSIRPLSSRPLRQQINQRVQREVSERIKAQLPPYMIPQSIIVLAKMPTNNNGKVDRKELAARFRTHTLGGAPLRQPSNDIERDLQNVWAEALAVDPKTIGLDDSFFALGGNSITAMKVVARARKLDLQLAVADVFRYDTLEQLAARCVRAVNDQQDLESVVLVEESTKRLLLEEVDSLNLDITSHDVVDILPLTSFQKYAVLDGMETGQHANYFYLDLGKEIDLERFEECCHSLLQSHPILRARFVQLQGKFWQVICHQPTVSVHLVDTEEGLEEVSSAYCAQDIPEVSPNDLPIKFVLLRRKSQDLRLILRLSHAQYDGISIPILFQSLMSAYSGTPLPPSVDFAKFLSHASRQRERSIKYWKALLEGSTLAEVHPVASLLGAPKERIYEEAEIDLPQLPNKTTSAALFSAAFAMLLSSLTSEDDIAFGQLNAGRNSSMQAIDRVVGPCINIVPIRVAFPTFETPRQLLLAVQEQLISMGDADTLGSDDIIEHCTNWPAGTRFETVIQHQNIDEHPEFETPQGSSQVQFFENPDIIPPSLFLASYPQGNRLRVRLFANTHIVSKESVGPLLASLCRIMVSLGHSPDGSLQSLLDRMGRVETHRV